MCVCVCVCVCVYIYIYIYILTNLDMTRVGNWQLKLPIWLMRPLVHSSSQYYQKINKNYEPQILKLISQCHLKKVI